MSSNHQPAVSVPPILVAQVTQHLKITMTPEQYASLRQDYRTSGGTLYIPYSGKGKERSLRVRRFWEALPEYVIARCPICGANYSERMDTHSLWNGWLSETGGSVFSSEYQDVGCKHRVGVQGFIHLNGVVPQELTYYSSKSEVPYVTSIFLPDEPKSYVVVHSLPICRVEAGVFVPRYLVFMLTYYSEDVGALYNRRKKDAEKGQSDPDFRLPLMYTWFEAGSREEVWQLSSWIVKGKLWWLDLDKNDLPIKSGPVESFPYTNIQGFRHPFIYRNGKLSIPRYGARP